MWYAVSYVIFQVHDTNDGTHDIQIHFLQTLLMANLWPFKGHIKQEFYDHIPEQCINVAFSKLLLKVMPPNECEGKPLLHTVYHFIGVSVYCSKVGLWYIVIRKVTLTDMMLLKLNKAKFSIYAARWYGAILSMFNSLQPSDGYMRQLTNHDWFR